MRTQVASRQLQFGEQGCLLVLAELVRRGLRPYRPVVDDHGVDIMLYNGTHIQVKSANLTSHRNHTKSQVYQFTCSQKAYGPGARQRASKAVRRVFGNVCDFVILVGLNEKRFWIVPAEFADSLGGSTGFTVGPRAMPSLHEVKALRGKGKSYEDIATSMNCSVWSIWDRDKNGERKGKITRIVRSYEDRWNLIEDAERERSLPDMPGATLPTIYERDPDFVATLAGPIPEQEAA